MTITPFHPQERRKHQRIALRDDQGVVLIRPEDIHSYSVIDIGKGGVAIIYVGMKKWPNTSLMLDFIDLPYFLENVPVKVVSDIEFQQADYEADENNLPLRRCGVEFLSLTEDQERELEEYLGETHAGP